MNSRPLPDIQSQPDVRKIPIDTVGIKGLRYPITIGSSGRQQATVANWNMSVGLPAHIKGTHMSRFVELLEAQRQPLDYRGFMRLVLDMLGRLDAVSGEIEMSFPYFLTKTAPVSRVRSRMDYDVQWHGSVSPDGRYTFKLLVTVPVTSLCPCSKQISRYGAHNQRSHVTLEVEVLEAIAVNELIAIAERSASCELYGLLKRPDEKYVTERAYDNPKFVEDLVRSVAAEVSADPRIAAYTITAENFESIHNHSAFARIAKHRVQQSEPDTRASSEALETADGLWAEVD